MRAVELALALMAAPRGVDDVRRRPLPPGVLALLKAAAGDAGTLQTEARQHRVRPEAVQEACAIFAQQVLLAEGNDPFRTLGCAPDASDDQLRRHYGWLQRWLHPDRDPEGWLSVFADRVNGAWTALKRPETRTALRRSAAERRGAMPADPARLGQRWDDPVASIGDRRWVAWLPHAVVGAVLLLAVAVYWANRPAGSQARAEAGLAVAARAAPPAAVPSADPAPPLVSSSVPATLIALPAVPSTEDTALPFPPEAPAAPEPAAAPLRVVVEPVSAPVAAVTPDPTDILTPEPVTPPAPEAAPAPPAPASEPGPPPVHLLLLFQSAYARGDLSALMRLFAARARTPSGDWRATRDDYAAQFASTRERVVALRELRWQPDGDGWVAQALLESEVRPTDGWRRRRSTSAVRIRTAPQAGSQLIVGWEALP